MKTIEQFKKDLIIELACDDDTLIRCAVNETIKFAQRWISVDDELPKKNNNNFSDKVLTKDKFENVRLERYDFEMNYFNEIRYDIKETGDGQVTHWRPIELE